MKAVMALAVIVTAPAAAQSVADIVESVRDGTVLLSFAARSGVCSHGEGFPHSRDEGHEHWAVLGSCPSGPVRVLMEKRAGSIVTVRTFVGGGWRDVAEATDLCSVPASEAALLLVALARDASVPTEGRREAQRWLGIIG